MKKTTLLTLIIVLLCASRIKAQEGQSPTDTIAKSILKLQSQVDALSKIKISGYIQSQFQVADSVGIPSFAGGNFAANVDKRFMVRRGRLKATYNGNISLYVFQIDASERGIAIRDAYARITEPWAKAIHLTAGIFDRPFGFEIGYSSSLRETPERGRMSQIIFPGERDLGAMLTFQMPKSSKLNFLKVEGGMFNGTGASAADFDAQKDVVGRIRIDRSTKNEKISYGLGASYYNGGWRQGTSKVYSMGADSSGLSSFVQKNDTANYGAIAKREYMGVDFQITVNWIAGATTIRAEYIQGQQPGVSSATASPTVQPTADAYLRNFNGAYFYFIQNIWKTNHQLVAKYDWYDPNVDVAGDDIGKSLIGTGFAKTNKSDLMCTTIGLGWIYNLDKNVKIVAYYDMVTNEASKNLSGYTKDLKDNVFTLRVQYKF